VFQILRASKCSECRAEIDQENVSSRKRNDGDIRVAYLCAAAGAGDCRRYGSAPSGACSLSDGFTCLLKAAIARYVVGRAPFPNRLRVSYGIAVEASPVRGMPCIGRCVGRILSPSYLRPAFRSRIVALGGREGALVNNWFYESVNNWFYESVNNWFYEGDRVSGVRSRARLLRSRLRASSDFNRFFCPGFK
jgi:hypothetical protein